MATKTKIYLAGKITGLAVKDYTASFNYWKKFFTKKGYKVISPIDLPHNHRPEWRHYMREDIKALVDCDAIFVIVPSAPLVAPPTAPVNTAFPEPAPKITILPFSR